MKRKIIYITIGILLLITIMFTEYRFIVENIKPYRTNSGTVYIELFGRIDEYYADYIED